MSKINLSTFKTKKCKNNFNHNIKRCPDYHFQEEKRRNPLKYKYSKKLCIKKNCEKSCKNSHNFVEQLYHKKNYKKKFCNFQKNPKKCQFGEFCPLAHSSKELKIKILNKMKFDNNFLIYSYKTIFCPFSKKSHNKVDCPYAHDLEDFKRPYFENLKPFLCENWKRNKKEKNYREKCANGFDCEFCHGWKEFDYHLENVNKNLCRKKFCDKNNCFFFHFGNKFFFEKCEDFGIDEKFNVLQNFETDYSCFSEESRELDFGKNKKITNELYYSDIFL